MLQKFIDIFYYWRGIDVKGHLLEGCVPANQKAVTLLKLQEQRITLLSIERKIQLFKRSSTAPTRKEIYDFTYQMGILLEAGISLLEAFKLIASQHQSPRLKKTLNDITKHIQNGQTLTSIFETHQGYFDKVYTSIIHAGEQSGTLEQAFKNLSAYQEKKQQLKSKFFTATYYPAMLLVLGTLITTGMIVFIIPQFQQLFISLNSSLPPFTQWVINICLWLKQSIYIPGSLLITLIIGFKLKHKYANLDAWIDRSVFSIPWISGIIIKCLLSQWCHQLSILLRAGLPLMEALQITEKTIANRFFQHHLKAINQCIRQGNSFSSALHASSLFPKRATQIITIGENSGKLTEMLEKTAFIYETLFEKQMGFLMHWIEPLLMIILTMLSGSIIIAMYLPIFTLGTAL